MDFKEHLQINQDSTAQDIYQRGRLAHWNEIARQIDHWSGLGDHCYKRLVEVYKSLIALLSIAYWKSVVEVIIYRLRWLPSLGLGWIIKTR